MFRSSKTGLKGAFVTAERDGYVAITLRVMKLCGLPNKATTMPENKKAGPDVSVLKALDATIGRVPRVSLKSSPEEIPCRVVRPNSAEMKATIAGEHSRYRLDGEMARGGMGAILKGRDTDLGRDLAVKVLLDEHRDPRYRLSFARVLIEQGRQAAGRAERKQALALIALPRRSRRIDGRGRR